MNINLNKRNLVAGSIVAGGLYITHRTLKAIYRRGYVKRGKKTEDGDTIH